jgi:hypothetical protein
MAAILADELHIAQQRVAKENQCTAEPQVVAHVLSLLSLPLLLREAFEQAKPVFLS